MVQRTFKISATKSWLCSARLRTHIKTASRLRAAAAQRLETQRAYYEEGRITIDRFLDAVSQHATGVGTEAMYLAAYNSSLVALEVAKGTLLDNYGIDIVDGPKTLAVAVAGRDVPGAPVPQDRLTTPQQPILLSSATSSSPVDLPPLPSTPQVPTLQQVLPPTPANSASVVAPPPSLSPSPPQPISNGPTAATESTVATSKANAGATTYSFQFSVNLGSKPIEVRGSVTITSAPSEESPKAD